jgi:twinkle protein
MTIERMILSADDVDFEKYMAETEMSQRVLPAKAFSEEIVGFFHGERYDHGDRLPFRKLNKLVRLRPGEVSVWSGFNGHGKSMLLGQVLLGLVEQGKRVCVASMEMQPRTTLSRICRQFTGKRTPARDEIDEFLETISNHFYLYDHQGVAQWKKLLAVLRYCAVEMKTNHFVIDSLLKCGIREDDFNAQKEFVDHLCTIARDTGMHIHLVCHSRKANDETQAPRKMDIRGSGSITDQVDNVFCVWRNKDERRVPAEDGLLIVDKQRNGEWEGRLALSYNPDSQAYADLGDQA